ncbi:serine protease [Actinorhabdospora filicis]|uniref:Serine protease n=2 Tax=Actinorhabdospora filicis TaxID=1785913 RepID=A0A9W6W8N2_9ACTN|nr:serine protease [Actinorhabdospora filicis]
MAALGVAALALTGAPAAANAAEGTAAPWSQAGSDASSSTVTLVTGDKVTLHPDGRFVFVPGAGRETIGYNRFATRRDGRTELYVVPNDAAKPLAAGTLDPRLFNVTALTRDGLAGDTLPLIVQYTASAYAARSASSLAGATRSATLSSINADGVRLPAAGATAFWNQVVPGGATDRSVSPGIAHVWLNGKKHVTLDESVQQVGGNTAWQSGYSGTGITVAVLDTGIDLTHPDFRDRVLAVNDFTNTSPTAVDGNGHGTHVASITAGSGAASNGRFRGVAPDAKLLIGKVCDNAGQCTDEDIIEGMQWAASQHATAVNMSLSGDPSDGTDPLSAAINNITELTGTLFVVAAGNEGAFGTVGSPGTADSALTVGSVTKSDGLSGFSSQGPRFGDYAVKPDVVAPGSAITAALASGLGFPASQKYVEGSGTSMATPHVTGAVALMKQSHPAWTAAQLKSAIMNSSKRIGSGVTVFQQGAGRLDIGQGVTQTVYSDSGSLSFGRYAFPHTQPAVTRTARLNNPGTTPVTVSLAFTAYAPNGEQAPAGLFTTDRAAATIPPGASVDVNITFTPSPSAASGSYSGDLVATSTTGVRVRVVAGAYLEPEMHDIVIAPKARTGSTVDVFGAAVLNLDTGASHWITTIDAQGKARAHVPLGRYQVIGNIGSNGAAASLTSFASALTVGSADVNLNWDANQGVRRSYALADRTDEVRQSIDAETTASSLDGSSSVQFGGTAVGSAQTIYTVPTTVQPAAGFWYSERVTLIKSGTPNNTTSPYRYNLYGETSGRLPDTVSVNARDADLAVETGVYQSQGKTAPATRLDYALAPGAGFAVAAFGQYNGVPSTVREYFQATTGWQWQSDLVFGTANSYETQSRSLTRPIASTTYQWNRAPIQAAGATVIRRGDQMTVIAPMFSGPDQVTDTFTNTGITGTSVLLMGGTELYRDPTACASDYELPPGLSGRFVYRCTETRPAAWTTLGTSATGEWSFDSATTASETIQQLTTVHVAATGVENGAAKVGVRQDVTLDVVRATGSPEVKKFKYEVSYDGGTTWIWVTVSRVGDHGTASLVHPAGSTSVSTRITVTDTANNTAIMTVIRSYNLVP